MAYYFDLDGTLLDNGPRHYAVYCDILRALSQAALPMERYWSLKRSATPNAQIVGACAPEFSKRWLEQIELPAYLRLDTVLPGVQELLGALRPHGPVVLVTMRQSASALQRQLRELHLAAYFDAVLVAGQHGGGWREKAALIRHFDSHPDGWLVGDTEADVLAAQAVGIQACAVAWGIRSPEFLAQLQPTILVANLSELARLFTSNSHTVSVK